jgi:hypothetical protein
MTDDTTNTEQSRVSADCPNERLVSNLVDGLVPAKKSCFASDLCEFKRMAFNGAGCPVADGRIQEQRFSCELARSFEANC